MRCASCAPANLEHAEANLCPRDQRNHGQLASQVRKVRVMLVILL